MVHVRVCTYMLLFLSNIFCVRNRIGIFFRLPLSFFRENSGLPLRYLINLLYVQIFEILIIIRFISYHNKLSIYGKYT